MQKQWFDFSKRVHAKSVSGIALLVWVFLGGDLARSAEDYLHLPAVDLEAPSQAKVGDKIIIPLEGEGQEVKAPEAQEGAQPDASWKLVENQIVFVQPGKAKVPSLVIYDAAHAAVRRTNPIEVDVQTSVNPQDPEPQKAFDDVPPMSLKFPWVIAVLGGLIFLALLGVIFKLFKRWKEKKSRLASAASKTPEVIKSEDEIMLEILSRLEKEKPYLQGRHKEYSFAISNGMKFFLGKRYSFDAEESTTSELIYSLKEQFFLSEKSLEQLRKLFSGLDRAKFTDRVPTPEECEEFVILARILVMELKRAPSLPPIYSGSSSAVRGPSGGPRAT